MDKCVYCNRKSPIRVHKEESGLETDIRVCDMHWKLLQNPTTALPLIRGNLSSKLRGEMSPALLNKRMNNFFDTISSWKPTDSKG